MKLSLNFGEIYSARGAIDFPLEMTWELGGWFQNFLSNLQSSTSILVKRVRYIYIYTTFEVKNIRIELRQMQTVFFWFKGYYPKNYQCLATRFTIYTNIIIVIL